MEKHPRNLLKSQKSSVVQKQKQKVKPIILSLSFKLRRSLQSIYLNSPVLLRPLRHVSARLLLNKGKHHCIRRGAGQSSLWPASCISHLVLISIHILEFYITNFHISCFCNLNVATSASMQSPCTERRTCDKSSSWSCHLILVCRSKSPASSILTNQYIYSKIKPHYSHLPQN